MSGGHQEHMVSQGEDLMSIALQYRVSADDIWNDPKNLHTRSQRANDWRHKLGSLQESPYVLQPGDVLYIPTMPPQKTPIATDQRHVFRRKSVLEPLVLFLKEGDNPRKGVGYTLSVEDGKYRQNQVLEGTTGDDGKIEYWVDCTAPAATLHITSDPAARRTATQADATQESYRLLLRHMDPVTTDWGLRARLSNLGYLRDMDAIQDEVAQAIRSFHKDCGLRPSPVATADTYEWLVKKHGS